MSFGSDSKCMSGTEHCLLSFLCFDNDTIKAMHISAISSYVRIISSQIIARSTQTTTRNVSVSKEANYFTIEKIYIV